MDTNARYELWQSVEALAAWVIRRFTAQYGPCKAGYETDDEQDQRAADDLFHIHVMFLHERASFPPSPASSISFFMARRFSFFSDPVAMISSRGVSSITNSSA